MLYGVEMHVIDMSLEIQIVTDRMLPESTLPQRNLSIFDGARPAFPT